MDNEALKFLVYQIEALKKENDSLKQQIKELLLFIQSENTQEDETKNKRTIQD